ncbi:MAG: mercury(II) reductase [Anaerolineae bacterium]
MTDTLIKLNITGMTCPGCASHVQTALGRVPGVKHVDVPGWQSSVANVTADANVTDETLIEAVSAAGYGAAVIDRVPLAEAPTIDTNASDFDLLVIGGGSGGFAAAIAASELDRRVGMINDGVIGGTCVNVGCVPSKTLLRAAQANHMAGAHPFKGVNTRQDAPDWPTIRAEKDALVAALRQSKYVDVLAAYPNVTLIEGRAQFEPDGAITVGERRITADRTVIATGARPKRLPLPGLEEADPLDSTRLLDLPTLPESLIVLGGRAVAVELGQMMARLGVRVLILQRSSRLIPEHEPEIGRALKEALEQEGIGVITGVQVERLSRDGNQRVVHARVMGQMREFRADQILMATGRQPNTDGLGLDRVGVDTDANGAILTNDFLQTTNPAIYAAGDVTTRPQFVYVAAAAGGIAARHAFGAETGPLDLSAMPAVIFSDPQVATVGLTESQARVAGYTVMTSTLDLKHVPRAQAARDTRGLIKLVADEVSGRLLGAHILAAEGGEVIQSAALAVKFDLTVDDLASSLFPYLTQVEGLKLAALNFKKDVTMLSCCAV